ncbi:MAG: hypothetical protein ACLPH3_00565 [Terracidiphilus sp.]
MPTNKLMSLDGSIIELSATMFDWAKYTQQKGAIKLHLLLDHDGYLPSFAVVTEGKYNELNVARDLRLKAGTILAVDRLQRLCVVRAVDAARGFLRHADEDQHGLHDR